MKPRSSGSVDTATAAVTILWQDSLGGLEVRNKRGDWVGVPPIADTFVINIANLLQRWTNGRFSSTEHRVINRYGKDRYSIAFFVYPSHATVIRAGRRSVARRIRAGGLRRGHVGVLPPGLSAARSGERLSSMSYRIERRDFLRIAAGAAAQGAAAIAAPSLARANPIRRARCG